MMMPRLVKAVADPQTGEVVHSEPVMVRRVVSPETAYTLQEFCLQVVEAGTAQAAKVGFMQVAGKTGTAQKAGPRGYLANRYVSSFVGFAPYHAPRIACLVMIDEPKWSNRFGGDSAAPAFARICESLANSTPMFDDVLSVEMVRADTERGRRGTAPNFLRMDRTAALDAARRAGTNVLCDGDAGRVVAQTPAPGTVMDRNGVVRLVVSTGRGEGRRVRVDVKTHERMREAYRDAPAEGGGEHDDAEQDGVRLGTGQRRFGAPVAMAGVRGRRVK
jgi:stage V sporulation protein D (sporulation-specific penicillin-binding protein)